MKKIVSRVVAFYKESILDIYGYLKYMGRSLIRYNLVFIIVAAMSWWVCNTLSKDDFDKFLGVIISIIAATLFEGYRSYRKQIDNKVILQECYKDFYNIVYHFISKVFIKPYLIYLGIDLHISQIHACGKENLIANLKYLLLILHNGVRNGKSIDKDIFENLVYVHDDFRTFAKNILIPGIDRILKILLSHNNDSTVIKELYLLLNYIIEFVDYNFKKEDFVEGQVASVPVGLMIAIIQKTKDILNNKEIWR